MTILELIYVAATAVGIGLFLIIVRRASRKQLDQPNQPAALPSTTNKEQEAVSPDESSTADAKPAKQQPDQNDDTIEPHAPQTSAELRTGLAKTRGGFVAKLGRLLSRKKIDSDILEELEQVLLTADIGPRTADRLFQTIKQELTRAELTDPETVWNKVRAESIEILSLRAEPLDFAATKPFVLLTIGVNGVGKTTTIGKLAAKLTREGNKVVLAAGDTFRAAAVEQLEVWGHRSNCPVIKGKPNSDPSSVIFDGIKRGIDDDYDVVIADTAGRLHTKKDLMEELQKVGRVCDKALPGAPHETWLVLDATTGQNAIQQAQLFKEAMAITGIVLTKLDGTAKGGVILGISDALKVPVRFIGIGEQIDDLRPFDPHAFVSALYDQE